MVQQAKIITFGKFMAEVGTKEAGSVSLLFVICQFVVP